MGPRSIEILLVEDNPADAKMTKRAFAKSRSQVSLKIVSDGEQAWNYLNQAEGFYGVQQPDMVLLDLNLPRIGGCDLLKMIKGDRKLGKIPVIVLTTSLSESDIGKCYELHANSYIAKPEDLNSFANIIKIIDDYWFNTVQMPVQ